MPELQVTRLEGHRTAARDGDCGEVRLEGDGARARGHHLGQVAAWGAEAEIAQGAPGRGEEAGGGAVTKSPTALIGRSTT